MFATASHVPKLLPWVDWQEWQECSDHLFADSPIAQRPYSTTDSDDFPLPLDRFSSPPSFSPSVLQRQRDALERISLWRLRGRLPLSIDSTAELIHCLHVDHSISSSLSISLSSSSDRSLRHHYSLTLLRFVNSLVDVQQTRGHALSVSHLASSLGLPRLLVDIRHEATHGALPTLVVLRYASQEALRWLYRSYWKVQEERSSKAVKEMFERLKKFEQVAEDHSRTFCVSSSILQDAANAVFDQTLASSHLSPLLLPLLFSTSSSPPPPLCLRPPLPLHSSNPSTPSIVTDHFFHLLFIWKSLIRSASRRIPHFRLDAIRLCLSQMIELETRRNHRNKEGKEEGEKGRDEESIIIEDWQVQLMRHWCIELIEDLSDEEKQPSHMYSLLSLSISTSYRSVLDVSHQLLSVVTSDLNSSNDISPSLLRCLAGMGRTQELSSFLSSSSSTSPRCSLQELRAAIRGDIEDSEDLQLKGEEETRGLEEGNEDEDTADALTAQRVMRWLPCPLGVLPYQTRPNLLRERNIRDRMEEERDEEKEAKSEEMIETLINTQPQSSSSASTRFLLSLHDHNNSSNRLMLSTTNWSLQSTPSATADHLQSLQSSIVAL